MERNSNLWLCLNFFIGKVRMTTTEEKKENGWETWGSPPWMFFPIISVLSVNSYKAGGGNMEVSEMSRQKTTIPWRGSFPHIHRERQGVTPVLVCPHPTNRILKRTWICPGLFNNLYLLVLHRPRDFSFPSCDSILNSQESMKSSGSLCIVFSDWEIAPQAKIQWKH